MRRVWACFSQFLRAHPAGRSSSVGVLLVNVGSKLSAIRVAPLKDHRYFRVTGDNWT